MNKMLGKTTRLCDWRHCTCNSAVTGKKAKRRNKRRERQAWKKELSNY